MKKVLSFLVTGLIMASVLVAGSAQAFAASPSGKTVGQHVRGGGGSTTDGQLALYAIDAVYGVPIPGAYVTIHDADGNLVPTTTSGTNKEGYFAANVPTGNYKVEVALTGYITFTTGWTVEVGAPKPIKAVLMPTAPVPGPKPTPPNPCTACRP